MGTRRHRLARRLAAAVGLVAAVAGADELPDAAEASWIEATSPHFVLVSALAEGRTVRLAERLEALQSVLAGVAGEPLLGEARARVYVFASDAHFRPYKSRWQERPAALRGSHTRHGEGDLIAVDGSGHDVDGILAHESIHLLAGRRWPDLPLWFEEGLAELYETFELRGERVRLGLPIPSHLQWLRRHRLMPLDRLLAVHRQSPEYNDPDLKEGFYAQSWALAHYLVIEAETRRPQLVRFLELLRRGVAENDAFVRAFDSSPAEMRRELARYVSRPHWPVGGFTAPRVQDQPVSSRVLARDEVLVRLGDLLAAQEPPRWDEASLHYRAALVEEPDNGLALAGLGLAAESRGRWEEAVRLYREALAAAPDEALVRYRRGHFLLARGAAPEVGVGELEASVALDPTLAPAWAELGRALLVQDGAEEEALAAALTAYRLLPARDEVAMLVVEAALRVGRRDLAVATLEGRFAPGSRGWQQGRRALARRDLTTARQRLLDGELDRTREILERLRSELADVLVDELLEAGVAELEADLLEARRLARLDLARERLAAGDREQGRRLLEDLAAGRDGVAERAGMLLEEMDRPQQPTPAPAPGERGLHRGQLDRLNALVAAGELDGALRLLEDLRREATENQLPWIDRKTGEIQRARRHNAFVGPYNRAVDLFNQGRRAAAADVLRRLLQQELIPEDEAEARELLARSESERPTPAPAP